MVWISGCHRLGFLAVDPGWRLGRQGIAVYVCSPQVSKRLAAAFLVLVDRPLPDMRHTCEGTCVNTGKLSIMDGIMVYITPALERITAATCFILHHLLSLTGALYSLHSVTGERMQGSQGTQRRSCPA